MGSGIGPPNLDPQFTQGSRTKKLIRGFEVWYDPLLLKPLHAGEQLIFSTETSKEEVTVSECVKCHKEWSDIFQVCNDLETGLVTLPFSEYQSLPAKFVDCLRVFKQLKQNKKLEEAK